MVTADQRPAHGSREAWDAFLDITGCTCPTEWKGLGRLYGVSMGKGWVRMSTDPNCPHHVEAENRR